MLQHFDGRHDVVFFSGYLVHLAIDLGLVGPGKFGSKLRDFKSFDLVSIPGGLAHKIPEAAPKIQERRWRRNNLFDDIYRLFWMKYLIGVLFFVEIGDVIYMGVKAFPIVVIPVVQFLDRLFSQPGVEVDQTTGTAADHPKRIVCETSAFRVEKLFV